MSRTSKSVRSAFWIWRYYCRVLEVKATQSWAENSLLRHKHESAAVMKRAALQMLGYWACTRRSNDLTACFVWWKHQAELQAAFQNWSKDKAALQRQYERQAADQRAMQRRSVLHSLERWTGSARKSNMTLSFACLKHHAEKQGVMNEWSRDKAMRQRQSQRTAQETQVTLREGAARFLRRWSVLQRYSNLQLSFSWWKRHSDIRTLTKANIEGSLIRNKQLATTALRRVLNRLSYIKLQRVWRRWRAFDTQIVVMAVHLSLKQKLTKMKQKFLRIMKRKVRTTEQTLVLREARSLKLQLLQSWLTPWQDFLLPIHAIERAFRRWRSWAQKQTLELRLATAKRMVRTITPVVTDLRNSLQCQKTLNSWRNVLWETKQRKQAKLHSCLEDEKIMLARKLVNAQLKLDGVQNRLIDRQADHIAKFRHASMMRGLSIIGSLSQWQSRSVRLLHVHDGSDSGFILPEPKKYCLLSRWLMLRLWNRWVTIVRTPPEGSLILWHPSKKKKERLKKKKKGRISFRDMTERPYWIPPGSPPKSFVQG